MRSAPSDSQAVVSRREGRWTQADRLTCMPETIEDYYARVADAADAEGRLATNAEIQS